jgi:hypothetical protein
MVKNSMKEKYTCITMRPESKNASRSSTEPSGSVTYRISSEMREEKSHHALRLASSYLDEAEGVLKNSLLSNLIRMVRVADPNQEKNEVLRHEAVEDPSGSSTLVAQEGGTGFK